MTKRSKFLLLELSYDSSAAACIWCKDLIDNWYMMHTQLSVELELNYLVCWALNFRSWSGIKIMQLITNNYHWKNICRSNQCWCKYADSMVSSCMFKPCSRDLSNKDDMCHQCNATTFSQTYRTTLNVKTYTFFFFFQCIYVLCSCVCVCFCFCFCFCLVLFCLFVCFCQHNL